MQRVYRDPYTVSIAKTYHQILPAAFKRFSMAAAFRTALPTAAYYLTRSPLPASPKPALFTMNILPPMMTVWHHVARKYLGDSVDITIFDCSGTLDAKDFPGARVQKFLNLYAATKCDEFIRHSARNRRIGWLCDDDMFFVGKNAHAILLREFAVPNTASVSFRPRRWWSYTIDGKEYEASGSYCLALDRDIFWAKEHLSLAPANGNVHASKDSGSVRRYDTFDKANEILLRKGYRCAVVPKKEREECVIGFSGMSGSVILLHHFRTAKDVLEYYTAPGDDAWAGNVLPGTLASMLSICTIQECYEMITGKCYPMPSLPSRKELEAIRKAKSPLFRQDMREWFGTVDETSERLKKAL